MNPFILLMLICAAVGLLDKILGGRWGLARYFDSGLAIMGSLALSMCGLFCIGVTVIKTYSPQLSAAFAGLPVDPSLSIGCLLAPDMGAYPIALEMAEDPLLGAFFGVLVSSTLGTVIGYQLPVFLGAVGKEDAAPVLKGLFIGVGTLPPALLAGGLLLKVPLGRLAVNLLPVAVFCIVLIVALTLAERPTTAVLQVLGVTVKILSYVLTVLVIADLYVKDLGLVPPELRSEVFIMVFKVTAIICGSLVFSQLLTRWFHRPLTYVAERIGTNEYAIMGMLLGATNSLAMLPLMPRMDRRGKILNGAFSAAGAYVIGGQMAFISGASDPWTTAVFMITKLGAALLAVTAACLLTGREEKERLEKIVVGNQAET